MNGNIPNLLTAALSEGSIEEENSRIAVQVMNEEIKIRINQIRRGEVPEGYKKSRTGISPSEWTTLRLGDIYTERKENGTAEQPILTVSIRAGVSDGALDEEELGKKVKRIEDKTQYKMAKSGDLVFNMMRAWQGSIGVVHSDGIVSPAYIVATPNNKVYPQFMDYFMKTPQMINTIHRQSYGVMDFRLRLYWDSFSPIDCAIPSVAEQKKIAAIFAIQDKVIELKEKRIFDKQRQKKYLVQQLLTGKKRLSGFNGKWKLAKLSEVLVERNEVNKNQDLRICSVAVRKGVIDQFDHLGRRYAAADTSNYNVVHYGDIIYTKSPTGDFPYGIIKQSHLLETVAVSPLYGVFIPNSFGLGYILHTYLGYAVNTCNYLLPIVQKGAKNTINISNDGFLSNSLFLPLSVEEQTALSDLFKTIDREIDLLQKDLEAEKQKKRALMQLLLTGIVRVKV